MSIGNYNKTKAEIERTDANAYASERATVRDYADTIVEQIDSKRLEKIDTLSGATSLLKSSGILTDEMLASGQYFDEIAEGQWDLTVDAKEKIRAYVESMEDSLTAVVTNLTNNYSLDDFNSLLELSDKQSVSWTDYQNEFKELFGENWLADTTSEQYTALKAYYDKY